MHLLSVTSCCGNDKPIAFLAILPFPGVGDAKTRRISRVVVLPDFQGLGLGKQIVNYISALYYKEDHQMYIRTMNPALGIALEKDQNWVTTAGHKRVPLKDHFWQKDHWREHRTHSNTSVSKATTSTGT